MSAAIAMLSVHTSPLTLPGSEKDAGGMNIYIRELARALGQYHRRIDIFTRRTQTTQPEVINLAPHVRVIHIEAGPVEPIPKDDLHQYLPSFVQNVKAFAHRERLTYDLLHSHYWLSGVAADLLVRDWQIPHIIMFHTLAYLKQLANPAVQEPFLRRTTERQLLLQADRVIAATEDERTQMIRHCGANAGQIEVIPCGVDLKRFVPRDRRGARLRLGLSVEKPVLLFVGRLDPFKGPDIFLKAAALMRTEAQLVMVGGQTSGDHEMEKLRQLAEELGLSERVHFLGARPQKELPMIYSAADVTVVPSYHESFGLAAVESLACGTPVVATRVGGLATIVHQARTGYLVPHCPGFFAERLDHLLGSPDILESMRQVTRSSVLQYSWQSVGELVESVYEEVLSDAEELDILTAQ